MQGNQSLLSLAVPKKDEADQAVGQPGQVQPLPGCRCPLEVAGKLQQKRSDSNFHPCWCCGWVGQEIPDYVWFVFVAWFVYYCLWLMWSSEYLCIIYACIATCETSILSVQSFDGGAVIAVLNQVTEHKNANSPTTQRGGSLGGRSTEFKKTVWDWKTGCP